MSRCSGAADETSFADRSPFIAMGGRSLGAREVINKFPSTESTVIVQGGRPCSVSDSEEDPDSNRVERLDDDVSERRDRLDRTETPDEADDGAVLSVVGLVGGVTLRPRS